MRTNFKKIVKVNFLNKRKSTSISSKNAKISENTAIQTIPNKQDSLNEPKLTMKQTIKNHLKNNLLLIMTVVSVIVGISLGFVLRMYTNFSVPEKSYFGFPGEVFLRSLKFLILPLISSSLISGIAGLGTEKTGKIAVRALIFYFCSTFSAVVLGIILVSAIKPGYLNSAKYKGAFDPLSTRKVNTADTILDLLR
jgi:Na+/H+-dicarboxylate symporter